MAAGTLHFAVGKVMFPGHEPDGGSRLGAPVDFAVFSDTTFLWTHDDSSKSLNALLSACGLVGAGGLANGMVPLPFRAGLAYGEVHIEPQRNMFLVSPI